MTYQGEPWGDKHPAFLLPPPSNRKSPNSQNWEELLSFHSLSSSLLTVDIYYLIYPFIPTLILRLTLFLQFVADTFGAPTSALTLTLP